jgi:hypothetical protein
VLRVSRTGRVEHLLVNGPGHLVAIRAIGALEARHPVAGSTLEELELREERSISDVHGPSM